VLSSSSNESRRHHAALALLALGLIGVRRRRG
jgi:MYXO-CTERM domain-containing protein